MGFSILLRRGSKRQRGALTGIVILLCVVCFALNMALMVSTNAGSYVHSEMTRMGFGDLTAWVAQVPDTDGLTPQLAQAQGVERVQVQPLIFSGYRIGDTRSDNEGQLLAYDPAAYPYRILSDDLGGYQSGVTIASGEIYLSPAMQSSYDVSIGDSIRFNLSRGAGNMDFTVAGWFEDPFMGSSMIDMKSFLISLEDFALVTARLTTISDFDILGREGAMLHIFHDESSGVSTANMQRAITEGTDLSAYAEFVYTDAALSGFMLILQNIFTGFLCAFAGVLLYVAVIVIGHSISAAIAQEERDLAILKTVGYTSRKLRCVQIAQYGGAVMLGAGIALVLSVLAARIVPRLTVTSTGLLMPGDLPWGLCMGVLLLLLLLMAGFLLLRTVRIARISPVQTLTGREESSIPVSRLKRVTGGRGLFAQLALRQVSTGMTRYLGVCLVAALLVLFLSVVGRMNTWLGPNGEGLMDAFSAADHDLGVQPVQAVDMDAVESIITFYAPITDTYQLAMQPVSVNGVDYTVNAIDEPEWFHVLSGETTARDDQVLLTSFVAENLGVSIGEPVTVQGSRGSAEYTVSGIYQCANETGANIGMSKEGFARIGSVDGFIWCHHYVLADHTRNEEIMTAINAEYRLDMDVHTNSWSGLSGIVSTMRLLMAFIYAVVIVFILITVLLTSGKFLHAEQRDMAILKTVGFTSSSLRWAFALRFVLVVLVGSSFGALISSLLADRVILMLLSSFGVGAFSVTAMFAGIIMPICIVTVLFALFAYGAAVRLKRLSAVSLLSE